MQKAARTDFCSSDRSRVTCLRARRSILIPLLYGVSRSWLGVLTSERPIGKYIRVLFITYVYEWIYIYKYICVYVYVYVHFVFEINETIETRTSNWKDFKHTRHHRRYIFFLSPIAEESTSHVPRGRYPSSNIRLIWLCVTVWCAPR